MSIYTLSQSVCNQCNSTKNIDEMLCKIRSPVISWNKTVSLIDFIALVTTSSAPTDPCLDEIAIKLKQENLLTKKSVAFSWYFVLHVFIFLTVQRINMKNLRLCLKMEFRLLYIGMLNIAIQGNEIEVSFIERVRMYISLHYVKITV